MTDTITFSEHDQEKKKLATIVYVLQALGFVIGVTYIAAVIFNYYKKEEVAGHWVASHFRWQMRTFWFSVLWVIVGIISAIFIVGYIVLGINAIWVVYRIVKGWLYLNDGKEMYKSR